MTLDPLKRVASRACPAYRQVLSWGIEALHRAIDGLACATAVHMCSCYGIQANLDWRQTLGASGTSTRRPSHSRRRFRLPRLHPIPSAIRSGTLEVGGAPQPLYAPLGHVARSANTCFCPGHSARRSEFHTAHKSVGSSCPPDRIGRASAGAFHQATRLGADYFTLRPHWRRYNLSKVSPGASS